MRTTVKAILLNNQNQVLLLSDRNNHYDLPGGGVDEGETPEEACIRELKEETPYEHFEIIEKLPNQYPYYVKKNPDFKSIMHCYVVKLINETKVSELEPDTIIEWVGADDVLEYFGNRDTPRQQAMKSSISDFSKWYEVMKLSLESLIKISDKSLIPSKSSISPLVKTNKTYIISSTDGKKNISNSLDLFKLVFLNKEEIKKTKFFREPTNPVNTTVYMLVNDSTIYKMFESFGDNFNVICFTQHQILAFLEKYKKELVGTWHFLYKVEKEFMIIQACIDRDNSMRLFGGSLQENELDNIYSAARVSFKFVIPE